LLDHVIVLNQAHLDRLLRQYIDEYYHVARPHQGLGGETPVPHDKHESIAAPTRIISIPVVGGLYHRYVRVAA
jgi:putative transposase